ncbi:MAG: hypothetical protein ACI8W8_004489, partial [Rhodothermales bacterium]
MATELSLQLDDTLAFRAEAAAMRRGKSVPALIAAYLSELASQAGDPVPPITASLARVSHYSLRS